MSFDYEEKITLAKSPAPQQAPLFPILAAPFTNGVSLVGLGLSAPRIHNARKKRDIIEVHLQVLGLTHHTRKRDILGSMAISSTIGAVTLGMAHCGAENIGQIGVKEGISAIVHNRAVIEAVAHMALDGVGAGLEEAHHQKKERKERKKMKREKEMMLKQFQRWKAEEKRAKSEASQGKMMNESTAESPPEYTTMATDQEGGESGQDQIAVTMVKLIVVLLGTPALIKVSS
ncbi:hypothetical protein G7Y89_g5234 [Cudoniella acicularis]|uniref:Uncharacterized protein n=1 Tax=Cudoniella acicularis TaxID=354080 RepID=A0A8H4RMV6_9HELO|nr:hypothetical protein G7Y89_g5234 [Cudoniella acicularis]